MAEPAGAALAVVSGVVTVVTLDVNDVGSNGILVGVSVHVGVGVVATNSWQL